MKVSANGDVYYSAGSKDITTSKVYRRDVSTSTFNDITPTSITNRGRIEIATAPSDNNYVYLSIAKQRTVTTTASGGGGLSAVLVSDNMGANWTVITLGTAQFDPFSSGTFGYGDYSNTIAVYPNNPKGIFLGGELLYYWAQITGNPLGQGNWNQVGSNFPIPQLYIHPKIHDVKFDVVSGAFYVATDGGITKSVGGGFLPYNKGFNISQFNSVTFPIYPRYTQASASNTLVPYAGVAGGSIGNNLTYLPGYFSNGIQTSTNFGSTDAYQSDFSKIVPKAIFYSGTFGSIFRTSDIDVAPVTTFYDQSYRGSGNGAPGSSTFANENTPMRLWENDGNLDSAIFYNEIASTSFLNNNASKTSFVTINARPQTAGKYDTIIITSVSTKLTPLPTQTIHLIPAYTGTNITGMTVLGDANVTSASNNTVYVNSSLTDSVKYTFLAAPNDSSDISIVFKLRYAAGDQISLVNTDISGQTYTTTTTLTSPLFATASATSMPVVRLPLAKSARLAVGINAKTASEGPSIYVVKRPLNFANNPDWVKVAGKYSRKDDVGGVPSSTVAAILGTSITRLEWANDGRSIYFSSKLNDTTYYFYRISHLDFIADSSNFDYVGQFSSDVDSVPPKPNPQNAQLRKKTLQRTTCLGKFKYPITSISVLTDNSGVMITTGSYKNNVATVYTSNGDVRTMNENNADNTNFTSKNGSGLPLIPAYSSLFEMNDNKRALVGTENGIYSTNDITVASPSWVKDSGGNFPNVPVFQIRQQTYPSYKCYNSGIIYAATHGRGIWSTDKYLTHYAIGVEENANNLSFNSNIKLYPNPASDLTNVLFNAKGDANYKISVYDISGRMLIEQTTGKVMEGQQLISINTANLNSGVYFVTVNGTNNFNATTKMVITR